MRISIGRHHRCDSLRRWLDKGSSASDSLHGWYMIVRVFFFSCLSLFSFFFFLCYVCRVGYVLVNCGGCNGSIWYGDSSLPFSQFLFHLRYCHLVFDLVLHITILFCLPVEFGVEK
jgi:hypothetical protein